MEINPVSPPNAVLKIKKIQRDEKTDQEQHSHQSPEKHAEKELEQTPQHVDERV